ncbi:cyclic nucleotide-binding domain-containing protein [Treponema sp.]|uniref:Crp/Fnr family transcriptional regulator n=1 Tax=Treponema sp. TaxID=166 RepID=UPI00298E205E|nr:cyclic nucleotide-binding domain-containing protein [Treponema sp.]MCR5612588.1 cyclic nucleotide-binding domain-containing protein [Treponema sp.]
MLQLAFVNFKKGSYLVVEGQNTGDRFYIIQVGHVQCVHETNIPVSDTNNILGPGDFVGVIPCMSNHLQIESAIAMTDVVCISVRRDQYPELIERNTPVAMKIIRTFANKMRLLNENLTKLALNNVVQESPEQIFTSARVYEEKKEFNIAIYGYYQYLKASPYGPNAAIAKQKFVQLKPRTKAVYFEPSTDLLRVYPKGTMIFSECQAGADMFIIQEGAVRITKVVDGQEVILAVLNKGDMFGEMALLENKPRSASAIAHENCRLMTVNRKNFDQMVATQPQLIARLTTTLADRLWSMYRQLANTQLKEPIMKLIDMLALQMEKAKVNIAPGISWQTDLTIQNVVDMCGIPQSHQAAAAYQFQSDSHIRIQNGKIFVPNCVELAKQAAFYRKQTHK